MRLRILSDLHFEFHADGGAEFVRGLNPRGVDLVVLAGDITKQRLGFDKMFAMFRRQFNCPIVYVPGNHEYHESTWASVTRALQQAVRKFKGVYVLDNEVLEIASGPSTKQRILGTSLWYGRKPAPQHPLLLSTDEEWQRGIIRAVTEKGVTEERFTDFEAIENLDTWVYEAHGKAIRFLTDNVREGDIVVTHFLPTRLSTPEKFKTALSNCWFVAAELEEFIEERKPSLWVHGHTHSSCDYRIGPTRVVCNPFGYQSHGELNVDFEDNFNVDVAPV